MFKSYYNSDDVWQQRRKEGATSWSPDTAKHYDNVSTLAHMFCPEGGELWDAGCGAGAFGAMLADRSRKFRYTGADVSHTGVEYAQFHCR